MKLRKGDLLLCYCVGDLKKFFGLLEVRSEVFEKEDDVFGGKFPIRFEVSPIVLVEPSLGIHAEEIFPKLEVYQEMASKNRWSILVRGSLREFKGKDKDTLIAAVFGLSGNQFLDEVRLNANDGSNIRNQSKGTGNQTIIQDHQEVTRECQSEFYGSAVAPKYFELDEKSAGAAEKFEAVEPIQLAPTDLKEKTSSLESIKLQITRLNELKNFILPKEYKLRLARLVDNYITA